MGVFEIEPYTEETEAVLESIFVSSLREHGCICPKPLIGFKGLTNQPRCRLCNTVGYISYSRELCKAYMLIEQAEDCILRKHMEALNGR